MMTLINYFISYEVMDDSVNYIILRNHFKQNNFKGNIIQSLFCWSTAYQ